VNRTELSSPLTQHQMSGLQIGPFFMEVLCVCSTFVHMNDSTGHERKVTSLSLLYLKHMLSTVLSLADRPALRPYGPRSGQSAPVGRTVRACAEQFRVPSFVIWLFARFAELARNPVV
jgi:hypothetical protein